MEKAYIIKVTLMLENNFWVGIFERNDLNGYAAARKIFGDEPTDPELYDFVLTHYDELKFTEPRHFKLIIKRKNPKRLQREVRHEMEKAKQGLFSSATRAQEVLRIDLEKNKKMRKIISTAEREARKEMKFQQKQAKRKKKHQGH